MEKTIAGLCEDEGKKIFDINEKNIFCLHAATGLQCLDMTTQQLWNQVYSLQTR